MKVLMLTATLLMTQSVFAQVSKEAKDVARLLINSPKITQKLKSEGTDKLERITSIPGRPAGVTTYTLQFSRECECVPLTLTAVITEDVRPTWSDGSAIYTSSISVE